MAKSRIATPASDVVELARARMGKRGRPSAIESEAKEAHLLKTAAQSFLELGYERASLNEIARRARASKATIYSRYPDKKSLFVGVIKGFSSGVINQLEVLPVDGSAQERLNELGGMVLHAILTKERRQFVTLITAESTRFPELGREFWEIGPARMRQSIARYFKEMIASGLLRDADCEVMARQFMDLTVSTLFVRSQLNIDPNPSVATQVRYIESAVSLFLAGYGVHGRVHTRPPKRR